LKASAATADQAAIPGGGGPVRNADDHQLVETLAAVPHILNRGADWYKGHCLGNPKSTGTKLISVCGHVQRPGNYEITMGTPMRDLIFDMCGGMRPGRTLKAVIPGGSSVPIMNAEEAGDCILDYEGVIAKGSMLGSGGMIVMDDSADVVYQVWRLARSTRTNQRAAHSREGTAWTNPRTIPPGRARSGPCSPARSSTVRARQSACWSDSCAAPIVTESEIPPRVRSPPRRRAPAGARDGLIPCERVTVTIDGAQVSVPKGTTLIEAAKQAGVLVPHYCYHPSLPSPAVCRMCLVEVEKSPKLLPACVTTVADGQVVHTNSVSAKKAREGVLEFLLINHPLDCPICDQAGECELQDYTFQEGRAEGRHDDYPKRYNPVEEFGPDVLYVPNRCILCTRCVRFMEDVAKDGVLNVSERGICQDFRRGWITGPACVDLPGRLS
jgi:ferredoxin